MAQKHDGPLAQIQAAILHDAVPASSLLQKCVLLGGLTGSATMTAWARQELHGYESLSDLPDYRRVTGTLMVRLTNLHGYQEVVRPFSPALELPEQVRKSVEWEAAYLTQDIGELEALVDTGTTITLGVPWNVALIDLLNPGYLREGTRIVGFHLEVHTAKIRGLLVRVRTTVAELVAELIKLTPDGQDMPDKNAAEQAMQVSINGSNNTIHYAPQHVGEGGTNIVEGAISSAGPVTVVGTDGTAIGSQTVSGDNPTVTGNQAVRVEHGAAAAPAAKEGWWTRLRRRGLLVALAAIVSATIAVLTWLGLTPSSPKTGPTSRPSATASVPAPPAPATAAILDQHH